MNTVNQTRPNVINCVIVIKCPPKIGTDHVTDQPINQLRFQGIKKIKTFSK